MNAFLKRSLRFSLFILVLSLLFLGMSLPATAAYPERPVKVIVPWAPGGPSDIGARLASDYLSKYFGQPFVVTNISGAGGSVGAREVLNSKPDGYTLLWHHQALIVSYVLGVADFNWDAFTPVCDSFKLSFIMVVRADAPWKNLEAFLADARKRPNQIKFGTSPGSTTYFSTLKIQKAGNVKFRFVGGGGGATKQLQQVLGGVTDVCATGIPALYPYVKAGKLRAFGVLADRRVPGVDVPTLKEQGLNVSYGIDQILFAPKGLPQNIAETLSKAVEKMTQDKETMKKFNGIGYDANYKNQAETIEYLKQETVTHINFAKQEKVLNIRKK